MTTYHHKFIEFMYYASEVVLDKIKKVRCFMEGLLPEIRAGCTYVRGITLPEMFDQALNAENSKKEEYSYEQSQQKRTGIGEPSSEPRTLGCSLKQVQERQAASICWNCGELGHHRKECELPLCSRPATFCSRPNKSKWKKS